MIPLIFVGFILLLLILATITFLCQKKISKNTVVCFTGGLGSGKTYLGTKCARKSYNRQKLLYLLRLSKDKPSLYSNVPVAIAYKKKKIKVLKVTKNGRKLVTKKVKKPIFCKRLLLEHILMKLELPQKCVVFIDELGQFASQYEHDNPLIMEHVQEFIRFYRHYLDGRLILTDQSSANIVVPIRRRINVLYNLNNFRRALIFFYKVEVAEVQFIEESQNILNVDEERPYFFGYLPFKYLKFLNFFSKKRYDSRCYSVNYGIKFGRPFDEDFTSEEFDNFKTKYFIDIFASYEERQAYKKRKQKM